MLEFPDDWLMGLAVTLIFTIGSYFSKKIDGLGAFTGGLITFCMFLGSQWLGVLTLTLFFGFGTFVSQWKYQKKRELGLAQEKGGQRTIVNAISNGGMAGICGFLAWYFPEHQLMFEVMMVTSIASATSDTFSSELGNVYGRRYFNILTFRGDQRGKDGVISLEGTLAGLMGASLIGLTYLIFRGGSFWVISIVVGGMVGNFMDSFLGATAQQKGLLNNHQVNLASTVLSGLFILLIW